MNVPEEDFDLLQQFAINEDRPAFDRIVRKYINQVYHSALRQTRDPHAADDITQAVFLVLMSKAGSISMSTNLAGWLFLTTRYAVANYRKSANRRKQHEEKAVMKTNSSPPPAAELSADLDNAIAQLHTSDRDLILNHYFQQMSTTELSDALMIEEPSVRKRLSRAIEKLRGLLGEKYYNRSIDDLSSMIYVIGLQELSPQIINHTINLLTTGGSTSAISIKTGVLSMLKVAKIKLIALATTAILLSGSVIVEVHSALAAQTISAADNSKPAGFKATLKNGVEIELLGISEDPKKLNAWWNADGSPAPVPTVQSFNMTNTPTDPSAVRRELLFKKTAPPSSRAPVFVQCDPVANSEWFSKKTSEPTDDYPQRAYYLNVDKNPEATIHLRIAAGNYQIGGACTPNGVSNASFDHKIAMLPSPHESGKDVIVSIVGDFGDEDILLTAITKDGKLIPGVLETTQNLSNTWLYEYRFLNLSINNMKLYQFESRPYDQWVEFRNVSMVPNVKSDFQIATSDDAPTTSQPVAQTHPAALKTAPFTDIVFKGNKIDVEVDNTMYELQGIGETITTEALIKAAKHYDPKDWQKRIAEDLVEMCQKENIPLTEIANLKLLTKDNNPRTIYIEVPMTEERRQQVYQKRRDRGEK